MGALVMARGFQKHGRVPRLLKFESNVIMIVRHAFPRSVKRGLLAEVESVGCSYYPYFSRVMFPL